MFDLGVTLLGEIRCLSPSGVKGLNNQNSQIRQTWTSYIYQDKFKVETNCPDRNKREK